MTKITILTCIASLVFVCPNSAQAPSTAQASNERAQRHVTYAQLNRQIFHTYDDADSGRVVSVEKAGEIQSQLHQVISEEIISDLSMPNASASDIGSAITAVQQDLTDKPFVDFFQLSGVKSAAIGYVILRGDQAIPDTQPYLEFYDQGNGAWKLKAEASARTDFHGCSFFASSMNSGAPGESWFLAWGTRLGDTGSRLRVRLYGFDGSVVRTIWKRDELTNGDIKVSSSSIELEYDREYKSTDPNNRVHESLNIGPNGLQ